MGYKIELKEYPAVGYYTIKLEDGKSVCYFAGRRGDQKEYTAKTVNEAVKYCRDKLNKRKDDLLDGKIKIGK